MDSMQIGKQGVTFDETALKDAYLLYIWSNITLFSNNMPIFPTHSHLHELHIVCSIISYSNLHPEIGSLFLPGTRKLLDGVLNIFVRNKSLSAFVCPS